MRFAILGKNGLVGDAFRRNLNDVQLLVGREDIDLKDTNKLEQSLRENKIDTVINAAAIVGGIELNRSKPYDMLSENISLSESILRASINSGVSNLVQFCSNCSYPVDAKQPYKENDLFNGPAHKLNKGYASAKITAVHSGQCAEQQGLIKVYHPIPCSLFGKNDNYSKSNSHFVAAAIRKIYEAKESNRESVEFWGSGKPYREFMYADNLVSAVRLLIDKELSYSPINIGPGEDTPIKEVIEIIKEISGFKGSVIWDKTKPDGAMHKLLDSSIIKSHGWSISKPLYSSLLETYNFYADNKSMLRL